MDFLQGWDDIHGLESEAGQKNREEGEEEEEGLEGLYSWEYASAPPSKRTVKGWLIKQEEDERNKVVEEKRGKKMHVGSTLPGHNCKRYRQFLPFSD